MKYALDYDRSNPAILFLVNTDWLLEVLGSSFGASAIGNYERQNPELPFQLDSNGFGFGGVMNQTAETERLTLYRLDLPVMREEEPSEPCVACNLDDHSDCRFCKGTGHSFVENTALADNIGRTLSALTSAIHMFTLTEPLCGPEEGVLTRRITPASQPLHVVLGYRIDRAMEHAIRLWLSPDAFAGFCQVGDIARFSPIREAEEAIVSALRHMRAGTNCDIRADVKADQGNLYFDIDGECGLYSAHSPAMALPNQPMEYIAHDLRNTDNTIAMMAGIAALYPVMVRAENSCRRIRRGIL